MNEMQLVPIRFQIDSVCNVIQGKVVAVNVKRVFDAVSENRRPFLQVVGVQVVGVRVGNQQMLDRGQVQMIAQHMVVGVGREIDFDRAVDDGRRPGADVFAAKRPGAPAMLAAAK
jgi:hypothetical protein